MTTRSILRSALIPNQEYPVDITGASRVEFSVRTSQSIIYGYEPGITGGESFRTLQSDDEKYLDFGMGQYSGSLYFASPVANTVIELEVWTRAD